MEHSQTIGELGKALAAAQGEIDNAKKDSENPFFKSKYADLASVRDAFKSALSKHGLAIVQMPKSQITEDATIITVETMLIHSSGEWVKGDLGAIPVKTDPQGIGSCITYLRRYALSAATGVATEDDDGNAASQGAQPQQTAKQPKLSQKATEIKELKKAAVDVCTMLNAAGDETKWSGPKLNQYSIKEFGVDADRLELEPLRDLVKRLSSRLDDLKKGIVKPHSDQAEIERQAKLAQVEKDAKPEEITKALAELKLAGPVANLSLDALIQLDEYLSVPF